MQKFENFIGFLLCLVGTITAGIFVILSVFAQKPIMCIITTIMCIICAFGVSVMKEKL